MKILLLIIVLFSSTALYIMGCTNTQTKKERVNKTSSSKKNKEEASILTDSRDGESYTTTKIGKQIWMAENLRYNAPGSLLNPDNPSVSYGRLYTGLIAQTACPKGWHLPSDSEWNEMEMFLGMPAPDTARTFWRGDHGIKMKSTNGWPVDENGTNKSGFNGLPSGYYFSGTHGGEVGMDGLGLSSGYWCSTKKDKAWVRFLGAPLKGVNRYDDDLSNGFAISCRCVKNE